MSSVDLTVANKVHLMEPQWNPMVEAQAVDRVHRKGQTRLVTITRYIVPHSIESVCYYHISLLSRVCANYSEVYPMGPRRQIEAYQ